jgi:hypothetical protein
MPMNNRIMVPRASGFNPRSIAGIAAWYDASVTSSITIATGVSQWNDLSGNGRNLTQGTGNNQPAYTGTIGTKPALVFDGNNDDMSTATGFALVGADYTWTVFSVARADAQGTSTVSQDDFSSPRPPQFQRLWAGTFPAQRSARAFTLNSSDAQDGAISAVAISQSVAFVLTTRQSATTSGIWVNGGNTGTASLTPKASQFATKRLFVGSIAGGSLWSGAIGEVIAYSRDLTTAERQAVERYLGKKWGVTVA